MEQILGVVVIVVSVLTSLVISGTSFNLWYGLSLLSLVVGFLIYLRKLSSFSSLLLGILVLLLDGLIISAFALFSGLRM